MHIDACEPFKMYNSTERLHEEVSRVFHPWDVVNVHKAPVNGIMDEVFANVDVLHAGV
jgi:hypothetical protein